jgi:hypothetical protein
VDLTARLLRFAAARPHVLVVPAVGGTAQRLAVEADLARRGWPAATSPADTDVLAVAGTPGPELAAVVELLWQQVPAPRAQVDVPTAAAAAPALDRAAEVLADAARQRREPVRRSSPAPHRAPDSTDQQIEHHGHENSEHPPSEHGGAGHGEHQHRGHQHGGGMEMPGGLPMADVGPDRDGLMLDRLRVPLGPVLPDWPAGLVVEVVLQGDVVQEATARILDPPAPDHAAPPSFWSDADNAADHARRRAARHLDGLARLLGTAGWDDPAATARHLRDDLLAGAPAAALRPRAEALVATVRRSRTLRRMLRGVGSGAGDVTALLAARLAALQAAPAALDHAEEPADDDPGGTRAPSPDELAELLVGAELAAARLIVAAVDPDTDRVTVAGTGQARHG